MGPASATRGSPGPRSGNGVGCPYIAMAGLGKASRLSPRRRELLAHLADHATELGGGASWRHALHGARLMELLAPDAWTAGVGHRARATAWPITRAFHLLLGHCDVLATRLHFHRDRQRRPARHYAAPCAGPCHGAPHRGRHSSARLRRPVVRGSGFAYAGSACRRRSGSCRWLRS